MPRNPSKSASKRKKKKTISSQKAKALPEAIAGALPQELCDPLVWKFHQYLSSPRRTYSPRPKITVSLSSQAWKHLTLFIRTRELTALQQALSENYLVMGCPLVIRQLHFLNQLTQLDTIEKVKKWDDDQVGSYLLNDPKYNPLLVSAHTQQQARSALQLLLKAWVGRVLPGYTIEKRKVTGKAGRPPKMAWDDESGSGPPFEETVVHEYYENLLESLVEIYNEDVQAFDPNYREFYIPYYWKPNPSDNKPQEEFRTRMKMVVDKINQASRFGWKWDRVGDEYEDDTEWEKVQALFPATTLRIVRHIPQAGKVFCRFRDLFELQEVPTQKTSTHSRSRWPKMKRVAKPIPPENVDKIIKNAIRSKRTVNPEYLLYGLLGYYLGEKSGSIKGIITRERKRRSQALPLHPDFLSDRPLSWKAVSKLQSQR